MNRNTAAVRCYTVSALNREVRSLLESRWPEVTVSGEISGLSAPASGHLYFQLKDADASIRCAFFKNRRLFSAARPANGMEVVLRATLSLYVERGDYQLIVQHLEEAGEGALRRELEIRKRKLAAEGLFDEARKKPLPEFPAAIGVVTSKSGAALRDIVSTLRRRCPAIRVMVYPAPVQGEGAAAEIARMIALADNDSVARKCDALIVARGGGSLEDLWAFNEEAVVRAIAACRLPLVTGVGHQTDFTLADLAADRRAATPTAAAELLSPELAHQLAALADWQTRAAAALRNILQGRAQKTDFLARHLVHPARRLKTVRGQLAALQRALGVAAQNRIRTGHFDARTVHTRLRSQSPAQKIKRERLRHTSLAARLARRPAAVLRLHEQSLRALRQRLEAVNPNAVLRRGYAFLTDAGRNIVTDAGAVNTGAEVRAQLARGVLHCTVNKKS